MINKLTGNDILIITASHGNDLTTVYPDNSKEYVPIFIYGPGMKSDQNINVRESFPDLQAFLTEYYKIPLTGAGRSLINLLN